MHIFREDLLSVENLSRDAAIAAQSKGNGGSSAKAIRDQGAKGNVSPKADVCGGGSVVTDSQADPDIDGGTDSSLPSELLGKIFCRGHGGRCHQGPHWGVGGKY